MHHFKEKCYFDRLGGNLLNKILPLSKLSSYMSVCCVLRNVHCVLVNMFATPARNWMWNADSSASYQGKWLCDWTIGMLKKIIRFVLLLLYYLRKCTNCFPLNILILVLHFSALYEMHLYCVKSILTIGRTFLCLNNWNVAVCNMPVRVNILPAPIPLWGFFHEIIFKKFKMLY